LSAPPEKGFQHLLDPGGQLSQRDFPGLVGVDTKPLQDSQPFGLGPFSHPVRVDDTLVNEFPEFAYNIRQ